MVGRCKELARPSEGVFLYLHTFFLTERQDLGFSPFFVSVFIDLCWFTVSVSAAALKYEWVFFQLFRESFPVLFRPQSS